MGLANRRAGANLDGFSLPVRVSVSLSAVISLFVSLYSDCLKKGCEGRLRGREVCLRGEEHPQIIFDIFAILVLILNTRLSELQDCVNPRPDLKEMAKWVFSPI